jgi:hypothetical protein
MPSRPFTFTLFSHFHSHIIFHIMVRPTLTGSLGLLALLQPALAAMPAVIKAENPPAKTECQQNIDDHGEIYISPISNSEYKLACNTDHYGGDLDHVGSQSFLGCSGVCDSNPDCIGYAYTPGNCWLKKTYTRKEVSTDVDFALNIKRNLTAAPHMDPPKPKPATGSCGYYDDRDFPLGSKDASAPPSEYQYKCGRDHPQGDIGVVGAKTFDSCVGFCDTTKDCIGFAWVGGNGPGTCYLKGRITPGEANSNVDFASKNPKPKVETSTEVVASTSVIPSTSVVVSTSVSVVAPPPSSSAPPPPPPSSSSPPPPPPTKSEEAPPPASSSIVPETPSESSIAIATATETRTKWTLTGSSSVPFTTVTSTRIIYTSTGFATVPVKPSKSSKSSLMFPPPSLPSPSSESLESQEESKTESAVPVVPITSMSIPTGFSTILIPADTTSESATKKKKKVIVPIFPKPLDWGDEPLNEDGPIPTNAAGEPDIWASKPGRPQPARGVGSGYRIPYFPPLFNPYDIYEGIKHRGHPHKPRPDSRFPYFPEFKNPLNIMSPNSPEEHHGHREPHEHHDHHDRHDRHGGHGVDRVAKPRVHATPTSDAVAVVSPAAPTLTDEPFTMRLDQSATTGLFKGKSEPSAASNEIPGDEPESAYISAPMITRAIPTLDAPPSESVIETYANLGEPVTSDDLPKATYVAAALPVVEAPAKTVLVAPPTKLPCEGIRKKNLKKIRTRVTAGNKIFDKLYLEQWQPAPEGSGKCNRREGCSRKFTPSTHLVLSSKNKRKKNTTRRKLT